MKTKEIEKYIQDEELWEEVHYWAGLLCDIDNNYQIAKEIVTAIKHYKDNKPITDLINEILEMSEGNPENLHIKGDWLLNRLKDLI